MTQHGFVFYCCDILIGEKLIYAYQGLLWALDHMEYVFEGGAFTRYYIYLR